MKKEEQIMNGATAPETGSKPKEKDNVDQFPGRGKYTPKHKSEHRLLSFDQFVSDKCCKFDNKTIEKENMSGAETGDKGHEVLDDADKTKHTEMK